MTFRRIIVIAMRPYSAILPATAFFPGGTGLTGAP